MRCSGETSLAATQPRSALASLVQRPTPHPALSLQERVPRALVSHRGGDRPAINPRPRNRAYACPRPARTEGASRGIMRPGGRAVFRGDRALRARRSPVRHKCDPLLRSEPTPSTTEGFSSMGEALPVLPDVTRRREHLKRTAARGWAVASGAASTFRHRHSARSRRLRRRLDPAPSLGWRPASNPRGAEPAGHHAWSIVSWPSLFQRGSSRAERSADPGPIPEQSR